MPEVTLDRADLAKSLGLRSSSEGLRQCRYLDRIRDELSAMGIQLKDAKSSLTGEVETTWELKR